MNNSNIFINISSHTIPNNDVNNAIAQWLHFYFNIIQYLIKNHQQSHYNLHKKIGINVPSIYSTSFANKFHYIQ